MNVVDSSGWLEYFAGTRQAAFFSAAIEDTAHLVVPSITIYEVFKRVLQQRPDEDALRAVAVMRQGKVVELNAALAVAAARFSHVNKVPLADSVIYVTAQQTGATLLTQDEDLKAFPGRAVSRQKS